MLLPAAPTTPATINSGLHSPTNETTEENSNKIITYLHQLAGNHEVEVDVIMKDHSYARPWNWKPENIYVKPVKKLFFSKIPVIIPNKKDDSKCEEFIDVVKNNINRTGPPFNLAKARQHMDEFKRVANFVRPEDTEDWEEKIDKILWSPVQNRIFTRIMRIINSERLARLAKANSLHEPILRRTSIDTTAKRFRETLSSVNWDVKISQWLHSILFDNLPQEYLAIYLDILQTLRQKVPQLIDKMIALQPNINSKSNAGMSWETLGPLLKKNWDPVAALLNASRPKKLPGNPILIVTPNGMAAGNVSSRQQKWMAQLGNLGMVLTVNPHLGLTANRMTMIAGVEQLVQACRAKIQDVRVDYPGRPIILVGFNTGAALACQVGQLEHVTAIISLGFPLNTVDGKRGTPDDTLLDVRSPVMFVIGQNAILARVDDIEDLRERMLVPTSLVVVGSADDNLRISTSKKISEKISQSMVDRCVLDEIADFVGGILMQPHPLPLRSPSSINYESRQKRVGKRKNSTSSSVDSESLSPNVKKVRSNSPQNTGHGATGVPIAASVIPRGTLVALTGTASTQTPKKKSRGTFGNQNFSEQLISSRLTSQPQSIDNTAGGITLNIGSFASLAPVGPIRFEPTTISLQSTQTGKNNALNTSNTFIKVSKNNQVNIANPQNVAKIKMIMPSKKVSQRRTNNYKNINLGKTADVNMVNILTSTSTSRVSLPTVTVTNIKANPGTVNIATLPSIQTVNTTANSGILAGKSSTSSSILFTPRNSSTTTTTTTSTSTTLTNKVADISVAGGSRKQSYQPDPLPNANSLSSLTGPVTAKPRSPKISLTSLPKPSPQLSSVQATDKGLKIYSGSMDTTRECIPKTRQNTSLEDDLGNILDIPIIIANDGENLNNFETLSQTSISLQPENNLCSPTTNTAGNKIVFINNKNIISSNLHQSQLQTQAFNQMISTGTQNSVTFNRSRISTAQPTIKYTKIILAKKNDQEDQNHKVLLTKTNTMRNDKLIVLDSKNEYVQGKTRISTVYSDFKPTNGHSSAPDT